MNLPPDEGFLFPGVFMTPAIVGARSLRGFFAIAALGAVAMSTLVSESVSAQSMRISGAGISKVERDTRKLTISAQSSGAASGSGTVQFIHNSPAGLTRFRGTVACITSSGGTVQVTGTIDKGETATGALLDGKAFGFTIGTTSNPQTFSLPNYGEAKAVAACSGGRGESVPVTEDGFKLQ
ncbi:MAG: hypothetical protein ABIZ36_00665 [Gemmatimonadaceae bacterium]